MANEYVLIGDTGKDKIYYWADLESVKKTEKDWQELGMTTKIVKEDEYHGPEGE